MIAHHSLHLCFPRGVKKYFLLSCGHSISMHRAYFKSRFK
ncbi:TPA: hypothetical protein MBH80_005083 [Klebsiella pneumoniae]|nr:hypothetical protein [Klebsiella pneumoniae]HBT3702976.1 hypothetical protein [Klebsiella pneumoniae]